MLFKVERNYNNFKPINHKKLKEITIYRIDQRTVNDPLKLPLHVDVRSTWYEDGENHRISNAMITRDFKIKAWVMDCTIDDIKDLADDFGEIRVECYLDEYKQLSGEMLPVIRLCE